RGPGRRARLGDDADDLVAEGHRCRASTDRVRLDGDRDRSQPRLVDVGAADRGRLDAQQDVGLAGRGDGDVIQANVVASVPSDGSHAGCQPISAWMASASSMSSSAMRRWYASNGTTGWRTAAPAKIPWRTASRFRNWLETSMC